VAARAALLAAEHDVDQLIIAAEIGWSGSRVMILGAHIPDGSGNGWEKVYALEALGSVLLQLTVPTILAGDFNEPKRFGHSLLSFGVDRHGRLDGTFTYLHGVTHDRRRWQDAVENVLTPRPRDESGWVAGMWCCRPAASSRQPIWQQDVTHAASITSSRVAHSSA
jgi:hypothetical protein